MATYATLRIRSTGRMLPCSSTPGTSCKAQAETIWCRWTPSFKSSAISTLRRSRSTSCSNRWSSSATARPISSFSTPAATTRWRATWRVRWERALPPSVRVWHRCRRGWARSLPIRRSRAMSPSMGRGATRLSPRLWPRASGCPTNLTAVMIEVRKDVLAATGGKQVPWDHSALTGDFYFHPAAAPGTLPRPDADAVQRRLRELEEELKKKSDPQQTANVVALAQAKERLRQSEEANRQDQKRIFDIQYNSARNPKPGAETAMEIGSIQMQMARRGLEMKTLREEITRLEAALGLSGRPPVAPAK